MLTFEPIPDSLEKIHALHLMGRPLWALLFLLLVIVVPLFILCVLVLCIRTRMQKKWAWVIFILFGVMQLKLNWSTGALNFQALMFQLFGAGFMRSGLASPWVFSLSFPLGAVLFLFKRKRLLRKELEEAAKTAEAGAAASAVLVAEGGLPPPGAVAESQSEAPQRPDSD